MLKSNNDVLKTKPTKKTFSVLQLSYNCYKVFYKRLLFCVYNVM